MSKRLLLIFLLLLCLAMVPAILVTRAQNHKLKLFGQLLTRSLEDVRTDFSSRSCQEFSPREIKQGSFDALVTGYCKPRAQDFENRSDFLCAVGLNCSCPNGRDESAGCALGGSLSWSPCRDFDETKIDYCHLTASQTTPQAGDTAADWHCFSAGSTVNINDQTYRITDRGSAITGRRFDLWFDNCQDAFKVLGIYKISLPQPL